MRVLAALLVLAGATISCTQAPPQPQPPEQPPPHVPPERDKVQCPTQALDYHAPSPLGKSAAERAGPSAAEIVAKFGSRRTARFEPRTRAAARGNKWPTEVTVSITSAGQGVEEVHCPPLNMNGKPINMATVVIPVSVTLEFSGLPEVSFDAILPARSRFEVSIRGYVQLFGAKTAVSVDLDADDVIVGVGLSERKDLPGGLQWSSLCSADASTYVPEFFDSIPGPLVKDGAGATMTCFKDPDTYSAAPPFSVQPLRLLLTRVAPRGCRTFNRENAAAFDVEVSAVDGASYMPHPAPASLGVDLDMGRALLTLRTKLPPSDFVRSFYACPHPPEHASLAYRLNLKRGPTGAEVDYEILDLMYYCEDVIVQCKSGLPEGR